MGFTSAVIKKSVCKNFHFW